MFSINHITTSKIAWNLLLGYYIFQPCEPLARNFFLFFFFFFSFFHHLKSEARNSVFCNLNLQWIFFNIFICFEEKGKSPAWHPLAQARVSHTQNLHQFRTHFTCPNFSQNYILMKLKANPFESFNPEKTGFDFKKNYFICFHFATKYEWKFLFYFYTNKIICLLEVIKNSYSFVKILNYCRFLKKKWKKII